MSSKVVVKERCACGAFFEFSGELLHSAIAINKFRASHETCRTMPRPPEPALEPVNWTLNAWGRTSTNELIPIKGQLTVFPPYQGNPAHGAVHLEAAEKVTIESIVCDDSPHLNHMFTPLVGRQIEGGRPIHIPFAFQFPEPKDEQSQATH